jgi:hypothetical protein
MMRRVPQILALRILARNQPLGTRLMNLVVDQWYSIVIREKYSGLFGCDVVYDAAYTGIDLVAEHPRCTAIETSTWN